MNLIKRLRKQIGLSRQSLADSLGITYGAIANYELGTRVPHVSICYRLIDLAKTHNIHLKLEDIYRRF